MRWYWPRTAVGGALLVLTAISPSAQQVPAQAPKTFIWITEQHVGNSFIAQFEENNRKRVANLARIKRPYPFVLLTDNDGTYYGLTRGLRDMSDYEKWSQAGAGAGAGQNAPPAPNEYTHMWGMVEQQDWEYQPSSPRVKPDEVGFYHWDVYYPGSPARWGMTTAEGSAAGFLANADYFKQLVALYRKNNVADPFWVYTSYANSHPSGGSLIVETRARNPKDYYAQLVKTQTLLGQEGLALLAGRFGLSRRIDRIDFTVRRDLSYPGPGN